MSTDKGWYTVEVRRAGAFKWEWKIQGAVNGTSLNDSGTGFTKWGAARQGFQVYENQRRAIEDSGWTTIIEHEWGATGQLDK